MQQSISKILHQIRDYASQQRIRFKKHALIRVIERNIRIIEVKQSLNNCTIIESYPNDLPLPSYLVAGFSEDRKVLHIVVALDSQEQYIWIITVYEPNRDKWDDSFTKRKRV